MMTNKGSFVEFAEIVVDSEEMEVLDGLDELDELEILVFMVDFLELLFDVEEKDVPLLE